MGTPDQDRRIVPPAGPERRPHRLLAGTRFALIGLALTSAVLVATFLGFTDTDQISDDLAGVNHTSESLGVLSAAKLHLEAANTAFYEGVTATDTLAITQGVSRALSEYDTGFSLWEEYKRREPPRTDEERARYAEVDEQLRLVRESGEALTTSAMANPAEAEIRGELLEGQQTAVETTRTAYGAIEEGLLAELDGQVAAVDRTVDSAHRLVFLGGLSVAAAVLVATMVVATRATSRERRDREAESERELVARRNSLDANLQAALDMADSEEHAVSVVRRALDEAVPGRVAELLLAETPTSDLERVATTDPDAPGCLVPTPERCPAARHGQRLVFPTPDTLNACFYLQDRVSGPCSAVCAPLSVAGRTVGVIHVMAPEHQPPPQHEIASVDVIARKASERLGTLRAFGAVTTEARTDPLTALLNRRSLDQAGEELEGTGVSFSVAFADLDHFKALNDTHGHPTGDRALQLFAHVLRSSVRPGDLVGRYGGEEFLLVFPDCPTVDAVHVLERVQGNLAVALAGSSLPPFTASFGVATSAPGQRYTDVVHIADERLLEAKRAGRNRIVADLTGDRSADLTGD